MPPAQLSSSEAATCCQGPQSPTSWSPLDWPCSPRCPACCGALPAHPRGALPAHPYGALQGCTRDTGHLWWEAPEPGGWGSNPRSARPLRTVPRLQVAGERRSSPSLEAPTVACSRKVAVGPTAAHPVSHPPSALPQPAEPGGAAADGCSPTAATAAAPNGRSLPTVPSCPRPTSPQLGPAQPQPRGSRDLSLLWPRDRGKSRLRSACGRLHAVGNSLLTTGSCRSRGRSEAKGLCREKLPL